MPPRIPAPQAIMEASLNQDMSIEGTSNLERCLLDFVELCCHELIAAKTEADVKRAEMEMVKAIEKMDTDTAHFGRVCNRIRIAATSLNVALLGEPAEENEVQGEEHWRLLREELFLLKSELLRQDANADVVLLSSTHRQAHLKATPDRKREQSTLFQSQYGKVDRLLGVQCYLSLFKKRLTQLTTSNRSNSNIKWLVREAIEEYEKQINKLFATDTATTTPADDSASITSIFSAESDAREVPQELTGFLLKHPHQTSANNNATASVASSDGSMSNANSSNNNKSSRALAEHLLAHVESIVQGNGKHSQSTCQAMLRKLLQQWHDAVLEQPTLAQLGYGGVGESAPSCRATAKEDALRADTSIQDVDVSDIGTDGLENANAPASTKRKARAAFVPIQWVDSDDDSQCSFEPPAEYKDPDLHLDDIPIRNISVGAAAATAALPRHTNKAKANNSSRSIHRNLLQAGSDEDPQLHTSLKKKKRPRATPKTTSIDVASHRSPQSTNASSSPAYSTRISPKEAKAIQEGVRNFGLGRWRIIQLKANGALDRLTPEIIKTAYYRQMKQKSELNSTNANITKEQNTTKRKKKCHKLGPR